MTVKLLSECDETLFALLLESFMKEMSANNQSEMAAVDWSTDNCASSAAQPRRRRRPPADFYNLKFQKEGRRSCLRFS